MATESTALAAHYESVNNGWGRHTLPAITREEAGRAAKKLMRHFAHRKSSWLRRCWISTKPTTGHHRGWARLTHDISHRAYRLEYRAAAPKDGHSRTHAAIELAVVRHVVASGWLDGSLKPKARAWKSKPTVADRVVKTQAAIARWERKAKTAETYLKKYRARLRRLNGRSREAAR